MRPDKLTPAELKERNAKIVLLSKQGFTTAELSERFKLQQPQLTKIIKQAEAI